MLQNSYTGSAIATDRSERLRQLLGKWNETAYTLHKDLVSCLKGEEVTETEAINQRLRQLEQALTLDTGLPLRPWFVSQDFTVDMQQSYFRESMMR